MKLEILKGTRVILRAPTMPDAPVLYHYLSIRKVNRWLARVPKPYTLKCAKEWVESIPIQIKNDSGLPYSIHHIESNQIMGGMALMNINRADRSAELGYWIAPEFWGKGYALEAGRLLCRYAFSNKQRLHRLYAWVHSENPASYRVAEKIGFVREGVCRKANNITGRWRDDYIYALLKSDLKSG